MPNLQRLAARLVGGALVCALSPFGAPDGPALAASGVTLTPDGLGYLVNKDLGSDRYTISLNLALSDPPTFLNATGNVFKTDGSPPSFILCQLRPDSTGRLTDPSSEFRFSCKGTDNCETNATDCAQNAWNEIPGGDDVRLPAGFFLPPGGQGVAAPGPASADPASASRVAIAPPDGARALVGHPQGSSDAKGVTLALDSYNFLVNKDLGTDRYSISLNFVPVQSGAGQVETRLQSVTGNVFKGDGSPPSFIYCTERADSTGDLADPASVFRFACVGTDACAGTATGCAESEWRSIPDGDDVQLAASFFLPAGGLPPPPQSDPEIFVIGNVSDPPGLAAPASASSSATSMASALGAAQPAGVSCAVGDACALRIGSCSAVPGVLTELNSVCSCLVERPPSECITCGGGATGSCGGSCAFPVGQGSLTARGLCLPYASDTSDCVCYAVGAGRDLAVQGCGGPSRTGCPDDRCCADDPRNGCDVGAASSCTGICVDAGGCDPAQQVCGICPQGVVPPPCANVAGSYHSRSVLSGQCTTDNGTLLIPATTRDATSLVMQTACSLVVDGSLPDPLTGTIDGNQVELVAPLESAGGQNCTVGSGSVRLTGALQADGAIAGTGRAAFVAKCNSGTASCTVDLTFELTQSN